jgi:hypothetical protein
MKRIPLCTLVLAVTLSVSASAQQGMAAAIVSVKGQPQSRESADSVWKPARKLDFLPGSGQLRTGAGDRLMLICNATGTRVLMNENTRIEIHSLINISQPGRSIDRTILFSGEIHVKERGGRYELDTPTASVKASGDQAEYGTEFRVKFDPKTGAASVLVFQNSITIANMHGSVLLEKYQTVEVTASRQPGPPDTLSEEQAIKSLQWLKNF